MQPINEYLSEDRSTLLSAAHAAIVHGHTHGQPMAIQLEQFSAALQAPRASFVTLKINHALRGCIGTLEAWRPLIIDVAANAFAAANKDPRFKPVSADEIPLLTLHISILTEPEIIQVASEESLIKQLRPGIDGLIIQEGPHRSTFLPSVWESLPAPRDFLSQLMLKAGLPPQYWSDTLRVQRYQSIVIE